MNNNFLCTQCREAMCPDCLEIADEYAELLRMRTQELGRYAAQVDDLKYHLDLARKQAASWERTAKLGYPEVIRGWMDSLVKADRPLEVEDLPFADDIVEAFEDFNDR